MKKSLRQRLWVDGDLKQKEEEARQCDERLYNRSGFDENSIQRALELVLDVGKAEQDRETNLNTRGAAVASVAGIIVSVSGAVAKSVFQPADWTDWTKIAAVALFIGALFSVATAMVMAVFGVLRPKRGHRTKNFLGDMLMTLWTGKHAAKFVQADKDRLSLVYLDRCMSTLPEWHLRNREKARWLRRAWVFLAIGIVCVAIAAVFVLGQALGLTEHQKNGPATKLSWWHIGGMLLCAAVITWALLKFDWVGAGRRHDDNESPSGGEVSEIVGCLHLSPLARHGRRRRR